MHSVDDVLAAVRDALPRLAPDYVLGSEEEVVFTPEQKIAQLTGLIRMIEDSRQWASAGERTALNGLANTAANYIATYREQLKPKAQPEPEVTEAASHPTTNDYAAAHRAGDNPAGGRGPWGKPPGDRRSL